MPFNLDDAEGMERFWERFWREIALPALMRVNLGECKRILLVSDGDDGRVRILAEARREPEAGNGTPPEEGIA